MHEYTIYEIVDGGRDVDVVTEFRFIAVEFCPDVVVTRGKYRYTAFFPVYTANRDV